MLLSSLASTPVAMVNPNKVSNRCFLYYCEAQKKTMGKGNKIADSKFDADNFSEIPNAGLSSLSYKRCTLTRDWVSVARSRASSDMIYRSINRVMPIFMEQGQRY